MKTDDTASRSLLPMEKRRPHGFYVGGNRCSDPTSAKGLLGHSSVPALHRGGPVLGGVDLSGGWFYVLFKQAHRTIWNPACLI